MELLEEIDFDDYYSIYRDRFSDMGDFTFVFVGSFDPDSIRPLMVNCVLIAFIGIGALLSLQQQRPSGKPSGGAQESAAQADPKPGLLP